MAEECPSKDMVEEFEGNNIQVYLKNGAILSGEAHFEGNWVKVRDAKKDKSALCNLDHTISLVYRNK